MAVAIVMAMVVPGGGSPASAIPGPDQEAAERAAAEIQAAHDEANAAAAEYFEAQSQFEVLTDQAVALEAEQVRLQQQIDALRTQVEAVAVNRFVSSGSSGIPLLTDFREPNEQLQTDVLVNVATDSSADVMDEYDRLRSELEANRRPLADNQAALEEQQALYQALQQAAEEEVVHLEAVEAQRLEDERIYLAVLARQREEQRQREEAAARAAAEQAAAAAAAAARMPAAPDPAGRRRRWRRWWRRGSSARWPVRRRMPTGGAIPVPAVDATRVST